MSDTLTISQLTEIIADARGLNPEGAALLLLRRIRAFANTELVTVIPPETGRAGGLELPEAAKAAVLADLQGHGFEGKILREVTEQLDRRIDYGRTVLDTAIAAIRKGESVTAELSVSPYASATELKSVLRVSVEQASSRGRAAVVASERERGFHGHIRTTIDLTDTLKIVLSAFGA